MNSANNSKPIYSIGQKVAITLSFTVLAVWLAGQLVSNRPGYAGGFAPPWMAVAATGLAICGILRFKGSARWNRIQPALLWGGLFLMIWTANGIPFDLLRISGLIPMSIDWPGLATRTMALAAVIAIARLALAAPTNHAADQRVKWYGYAAFILALPYPVLRTFWAFGATPGLDRPGAGGVGFIPWLACIPWLLAAVLSLLLVSKRQWLPRRLTLVAGWTATTIVAMIGPAACWSLIQNRSNLENPPDPIGIASWVFVLFYISWFLWAIAAAAATRSYQLRTAGQASS